MKKIFISYRRQDSSDVTGRIFDHLKSHFGDGIIFKDVDSIALGDDFRDVIGEAVSGCRVLLAIIGDDWISAKDQTGKRKLDQTDDYVRFEISTAIKNDIPIIPILVENSAMPKPEQLPEDIRAITFRNSAKVRPDPDFHTDIQRVIEELGKYADVDYMHATGFFSRRNTLAMAGTVLLLLLVGLMAHALGLFTSAVPPVRTVRIEVPYARTDGTLATTGNGAFIAESTLTSIIEKDLASHPDSGIAIWFDNEMKQRFARIATEQEISFVPSPEKICPDDLVTIFWVYFKTASDEEIEKAIVSGAMASEWRLNEDTFAFVAYPFFEPQFIVCPQEFPLGTGGEPLIPTHQPDGVVLKRGGAVPIVLVCDDRNLRSLVEKELRRLGYDVHSEGRLNSLKESVGLLNKVGLETPDEKFEQIKQSYVFAILRVSSD